MGNLISTNNIELYNKTIDELHQELNLIAANYITKLNFKNMKKLVDENYCKDVELLTTNALKKFPVHMIEYLTQKIEMGMEANYTENDGVIIIPHVKEGENKSLLRRKRNMCVGVADYYVKIGKIYSSIVKVIDPHYYSVVGSDEHKKELKDLFKIYNVDEGEEKYRDLERRPHYKGFCNDRVVKLIQLMRQSSPIVGGGDGEDGGDEVNKVVEPESEQPKLENGEDKPIEKEEVKPIDKEEVKPESEQPRIDNDEKPTEPQLRPQPQPEQPIEKEEVKPEPQPEPRDKPNEMVQQEAQKHFEEPKKPILSFCKDKSENNTLKELPGIYELEQLYKSVYDKDTKQYTKSDETELIYQSELKQLYKAFTGEENVSVKKIREIPLRHYSSLISCNSRLNKSTIIENGSSTEFQKYRTHLEEMIKKVETNYLQLLRVLQQLFVMKQENNKPVPMIQPSLTIKGVNEIMNTSRELIVSLFIDCETDYHKGIELYDNIVKKIVEDLSVPDEKNVDI